MSITAQRPATGPALMEQLVQMRQDLDDFMEQARAHWSAEEKRFENIDAFIDPAMQLQSLMKQMFGILNRNHKAMLELEREVRQLYTAVELAISTHTIESQPQVAEHSHHS
jgi:hypothetical protein